MAFDSGRVSFVRYRIHPVGGELPPSVTQELLDRLSENAFADTPIGAPDEIEAGWITGDHLFDTQFTYEKNGFGNLLLFALRIDTNRVPSEIKQAYRRINEQSLASGNPSGFISKDQKKDARAAVEQQIHDDLASGKYRRSKKVDLLWDLQRQELFCTASGNTISEQLLARFKSTFGAELSPLTAGAMAGEVLRASGRARDWEDLRPSPFTSPPPEATDRDADDASAPGAGAGGAGGAGGRDVTIPPVPWAHAAADMKDFLGNEFLLWLWHRTETAEGSVPVMWEGKKLDVAVVLHRALDMECAWGVKGKQSLRGDGPTRYAEAGEALRQGKWPRKAGMILSDGEYQWELSLQADRMAVSSALLPQVEDAKSPREVLEYRLSFSRQLGQLLDALLGAFMEKRASRDWPALRTKISQWLHERRPGPASKRR